MLGSTIFWKKLKVQRKNDLGFFPLPCYREQFSSTINTGLWTMFNVEQNKGWASSLHTFFFSLEVAILLSGTWIHHEFPSGPGTSSSFSLLISSPCRSLLRCHFLPKSLLTPCPRLCGCPLAFHGTCNIVLSFLGVSGGQRGQFCYHGLSSASCCAGTQLAFNRCSLNKWKQNE